MKDNRETILVEWFKNLFQSRTPPTSPLDGDTESRVTFGEIRTKMLELGYSSNAVDLGTTWNEIFERLHLRKWAKGVLRAAGEDPRHLNPRIPPARCRSN